MSLFWWYNNRKVLEVVSVCLLVISAVTFDLMSVNENQMMKWWWWRAWWVFHSWIMNLLWISDQLRSVHTNTHIWYMSSRSGSWSAHLWCVCAQIKVLTDLRSWHFTLWTLFISCHLFIMTLRSYRVPHFPLVFLCLSCLMPRVYLCRGYHPSSQFAIFKCFITVWL